MKKIGIPKAFLYHKFFPMWDTFFKELGVTVVVSPDSNKDIMKQGIMNTIDEACLPLKVYVGHVLKLKEMQVDYIFVPRFISVEKHRFLCPKFLGLPDMIRNTLQNENLPPLLDPTVNVRFNKKEFYLEVLKLASTLNKSPISIYKAVNASIETHKSFKSLIKEADKNYSEALQIYQTSRGNFKEACAKIVKEAKQGSDYQFKIAVIGHSYILHDPHISMNLIQKLLEMNCQVKTSEMLSEAQISAASERIPKDMFWSLNREIMGAAFHHLDEQDIDGVILLNAFACGPDAITKELIERIYKRESSIPMLSLTIDEHTGEAGFITRLEAFIDMMKRKIKGGKQHEGNISSHGELLRRDESLV